MSDAAAAPALDAGPGLRARLTARLTDAGFAAGWGAVKLLPESVAHRRLRRRRPLGGRAGTAAGCASCGPTCGSPPAAG